MTRTVVTVVGMHRSGTSLTMQALAALGARAGGDLIAPNEYNSKGYWEAAEVVALHDRLLGELDRGWGVPEHALPIPAEWWQDSAAKAAEAQAAAILCDRLDAIGAGEVLALKDPRLTIFLPLWIAAAGRLGVELKAIICLRHPLAVAQSLMRRDRIAEDMSHTLWLSYTLAAITGAAELPARFSNLDHWSTDPNACLRWIADFTGLSAVGIEAPFAADLAGAPSNAPIPDLPVATWWERLSSLPPGAAPASDLVAAAQAHLDIARHFAHVAAAIRAEIGETPSYLLNRDLDSLRKGTASLSAERDALAARSEELLEAYRTEAADRERLQAAYEAEVAGRERLQAAYEAEVAGRERLQAAYEAEAASRERLRAAYEAEAAARAELRRKRRRLNPLSWFDP